MPKRQFCVLYLLFIVMFIYIIYLNNYNNNYNYSAIVPVKDVNQQVFVRRLGHYLKKQGKLDLPEWVDCVKTGYFKELPPNNPDWLYYRMGIYLFLFAIYLMDKKICIQQINII